MINDDLDNTTKMKLLEKCERIFLLFGGQEKLLSKK